MAIRGIRGAITVEDDQPELIYSATCELLDAIIKANAGLRVDEIASVFFTMTNDLVSAFPALAARQMGWDLAPMMCAREIPVPDSLPKTLRVLVHWNTATPQKDIQHVYLNEAAQLRPDLVPGLEAKSLS
ncbi:MAG: chorismate mutase [Anaerolineales bacterium]|nr:chorismate mutase [Anaerolineales bacterium]